MITSVLLDLDGTLIDSNDAHAMAWMEALRDHSISMAFQEVRDKVGMGSDQLLPALGIFRENPQSESITRRKTEIFRMRYLPGVHPFPAAKELVEHLMSHGFKLVVASSASEEELQALLKQAGLNDLLRNFTSASEAGSSKPEPEVVTAALRKVHALPSEALLIGDTPYDIFAARRAGVDTVAFTCGGCTAQELKGAIAIYDGPWALLKEFKRSPFHAKAA
jgi:HAD superfamily hydrolase (TIGR01549 family)